MRTAHVTTMLQLRLCPDESQPGGQSRIYPWLASPSTKYLGTYLHTLLACQNSLDKPKFLTKKSHVTQPNRHHDENPSYHDSYHITENANTKIIPRWIILSPMLYRLVCSDWAILSTIATYMVVCQHWLFFTISATSMMAAAHTT